MTVGIGTALLFVLPRNINSAQYLSEAQKELLTKAMRYDGAGRVEDVSQATLHYLCIVLLCRRDTFA